MIKMKNKKGVVGITLTVGVLVTLIIAFLVVAGVTAGLFAWIANNPFLIIGIALIAFTLIYGIQGLFIGKFDNRKGYLLLVLLLIGGGMIVVDTYDVGIIPQIAGIGEDIYPTYAKTTIVTPVDGYLKCEYNTRGLFNSNEFPLNLPYETTDNVDNRYGEACCNPLAGSEGCQIEIITRCDGDRIPSFHFGANVHYHDYEPIDSATSSDLHFNEGECKTLRITCIDPAWYSLKPTLVPNYASYNIKEDSRSIYIYTEGKGKQGEVPGTWPMCEWVSSSDIGSYVKAQLVGDEITTEEGDRIEYGDKLALGRTKPIKVGWEEMSGFNLNPLEKYDNQDVICKYGIYGGELFALKELATVGGKRYSTLGDELESGRGFCCNTGQCSGDLICEEYKCIEKSVVCKEYQCDSHLDIGRVVSKDKYVEINGNFYLETKYCNLDQCIETTRKSVACTPDYCSNVYGAGYQCDDTMGCVKIDLLSECPAGFCCVEGGDYKIQNCAFNQECCLQEYSADKYIGVCRTECLSEDDCKVDEDCEEGFNCVNGKCIYGGGDEIVCAEGETLVTKEVGKCNLLCQIGVTKPVTETYTYCKKDFNMNILYAILGGAVIIILGGFIIFKKPKAVNPTVIRNKLKGGHIYGKN